MTSNSLPTDARQSLGTTDVVVTDAGLETWLLFHRGVDLPAFAAYPLVADAAGRDLLLEYYRQYLAIAASSDAAVLLETPTWRANPDWAATLGHDVETLGRLTTSAVGLVHDVCREWASDRPCIVSGSVGPRGDGYVVGRTMDIDTARAYHSTQVATMVAAGVDLVSALTMGYVDEAAGVVMAAAEAGVASVISFTVETDGRLPSGVSLAEAIARTDELTGGGPLHYMINCAHPTHFEHVLDGDDWVHRIGGLRANASSASHAELDEMEELDDGDPDDLAARYVGLASALPALRVVGGCCGTDDRHVAAIANAWTAHVRR